MRLIVSAVLVMILAGLAPAAESGGLTGALERQRLDMATQQSETRREVERQSGRLQQQQDRNLQFQLLQRNPPSPPPASPNCAQVSDGLICR